MIIMALKKIVKNIVLIPVLILCVAIERAIKKFSLVGKGPFFELKKFAWTYHIESRWETIREELDLLTYNNENIPNIQDISKEQTRIASGGGWKTFFLYAYGNRIDDNCMKCPETAKALEFIPGMKTAFFSILAPGKHLPPHRGPFNGLLRYHLGVLVPGEKGDCRIRVEKITRNWEEGKSLLFDDSYNHEAWNSSDKERVVLIVDFVRPLPAPLSYINNKIINTLAATKFVKGGLSRLKVHNEKYNAIG